MRLDGNDLEPSSNPSDIGCTSIQPQPFRPTSALSLPSTSSEPYIDLTHPPSSLSKSYMWRKALSPSRQESLRSLHLNSQHQHQAIINSPLQPNRREDACTVATMRTIWVELRHFYLKSWQQRLNSMKQQEKQDECDRLGIEMAEGVRYYTDPCKNSILFYSRDSSILL